MFFCLPRRPGGFPPGRRYNLAGPGGNPPGRRGGLPPGRRGCTTSPAQEGILLVDGEDSLLVDEAVQPRRPRREHSWSTATRLYNLADQEDSLLVDGTTSPTQEGILLAGKVVAGVVAGAHLGQSFGRFVWGMRNKCLPDAITN
ncbi:hypothetical protein PGTUg99_036918 [Puccinia graminis f. sp. tritici]|uniref:Uncharacterized protein n=1 Tax=Puccinia graminis f. sp. tritici TaxID=56615 RepID=A0A5B0LUW8_PUCGR|nr:hypothetical protein PGTUg99_036918 [Puccinia graminis f. sp. tritici]